MKNLINLLSLTVLFGVLQGSAQADDFYLTDHIRGGMTCVIVQHEVADFGKWEAAYKADAKRRKKAGITEMFVLRGDTNSNLVTVVFGLNNVTSSKAFFNDPETAQLMGAAGVTSKPVFTYFKVSNSGVEKNSSFMIIQHKVEQYDKWKKAFDQHESTRSSYNIDLVAVGRDLDDPANVVAIFNSNQASNFSDFLKKSDLKEAMEDAGVASEPIISTYKQTK